MTTSAFDTMTFPERCEACSELERAFQHKWTRKLYVYFKGDTKQFTAIVDTGGPDCSQELASDATPED